MSYRKGQAGVVHEGLIFFSIEGSRFRVLYLINESRAKCEFAKGLGIKENAVRSVKGSRQSTSLQLPTAIKSGGGGAVGGGSGGTFGGWSGGGTGTFGAFLRATACGLGGWQCVQPFRRTRSWYPGNLSYLLKTKQMAKRYWFSSS